MQGYLVAECREVKYILSHKIIETLHLVDIDEIEAEILRELFAHIVNLGWNWDINQRNEYQ